MQEEELMVNLKISNTLDSPLNALKSLYYGDIINEELGFKIVNKKRKNIIRVFPLTL